MIRQKKRTGMAVCSLGHEWKYDEEAAQIDEE